MLKPIMERLQRDNGARVTFVDLDVGIAKAAALKYDVLSVPTVIVLKDNVEVGRVIGLKLQREYQALIDKAHEANV